MSSFHHLCPFLSFSFFLESMLIYLSPWRKAPVQLTLRICCEQSSATRSQVHLELVFLLPLFVWEIPFHRSHWECISSRVNSPAGSSLTPVMRCCLSGGSDTRYDTVACQLACWSESTKALRENEPGLGSNEEDGCGTRQAFWSVLLEQLDVKTHLCLCVI